MNPEDFFWARLMSPFPEYRMWGRIVKGVSQVITEKVGEYPPFMASFQREGERTIVLERKFESFIDAEKALVMVSKKVTN